MTALLNKHYSEHCKATGGPTNTKASLLGKYGTRTCWTKIKTKKTDNYTRSKIHNKKIS